MSDTPANWTLAAGEPADEQTLKDLEFAWRAGRAVKSNAIVLARAEDAEAPIAQGAGDAGAVSLQWADGLGGLMELSASLDRPLDHECVQITPADHVAVRRIHVVFGPGHLNGPTMGDGPQPVVAVVAV